MCKFLIITKFVLLNLNEVLNASFKKKHLYSDNSLLTKQVFSTIKLFREGITKD